jgi:hypothetical protein
MLVWVRVMKSWKMKRKKWLVLKRNSGSKEDSKE